MAVAPTTLGSLNAFPSRDETTHIGTCFPDKSVQLSKILRAPNSDELIKDLAILTSNRCVVWFRDQDITIEEQRELGRRMGELSGKPKTSTLHKHPVSENTPELGGDISVISSLRWVTCCYFFTFDWSTIKSYVAAFLVLAFAQTPAPATAGMLISHSSLCLLITLYDGLLFCGFLSSSETCSILLRSWKCTHSHQVCNSKHSRDFDTKLFNLLVGGDTLVSSSRSFAADSDFDITSGLGRYGLVQCYPKLIRKTR